MRAADGQRLFVQFSDKYPTLTLMLLMPVMLVFLAIGLAIDLVKLLMEPGVLLYWLCFFAGTVVILASSMLAVLGVGEKVGDAGFGCLLLLLGVPVTLCALIAFYVYLPVLLVTPWAPAAPIAAGAARRAHVVPLGHVTYTGWCKLRSRPSTKTEQLGVLRPGMRAELLEVRGHWRKIRLRDGKVGWAGCRPK